MSKKLKRCVKKVDKQKGKTKSDAYAICRSSLKEGVSKRRSHPNAEYTKDIEYIITRYLGFVRQSQGPTSHIKFTRDLDGTTVGLKLVRNNMLMKGNPWKDVLAKVFWWVQPGEREALWTLARKLKEKALQEPRLVPPRRRDASTMHGATARENTIYVPSFSDFFDKSA